MIIKLHRLRGRFLALLLVMLSSNVYAQDCSNSNNICGKIANNPSLIDSGYEVDTFLKVKELKANLGNIYGAFIYNNKMEDVSVKPGTGVALFGLSADVSKFEIGAANIQGGLLYNSGSLNIVNGFDFIKNEDKFFITSARLLEGGYLYNSGKINNNAPKFKLNSNVLSNGDVHGGFIYNSGTINNVSFDASVAITDKVILVRATGNLLGGVVYNTGTITNVGEETKSVVAQSNTASAIGGFIYNEGTLVIDSDLIANQVKANSGSGFGGAAANDVGVLTFKSKSFKNNAAYANINSYGGAIFNGKVSSAKVDKGRKIEFDYQGGDTTFENNFAQANIGAAYGGAILNSTDPADTTKIYTVDFKGKKYIFTQNYTEAKVNYSGGGAISNDGIINFNSTGILEFTQNYSISNNNKPQQSNKIVASVTASGGAIDNDGNINFASSVTNVNFSKNYTKGYAAFGGAMSSDKSIKRGVITTTISTIFNFEENYASGSEFAYGGAIANTGTISTLKGTFSKNYADAGKKAYGGAIANVSGSITFEDTNFEYNYAISKDVAMGGAIYNENGNIIIKAVGTDVLFKNNYVVGKNSVFGGAIYNNKEIQLLPAADKSIGFSVWEGSTDSLKDKGKFTTNDIYNDGVLKLGDAKNSFSGSISFYTDVLGNGSIEVNGANVVINDVKFNQKNLTINSGSVLASLKSFNISNTIVNNASLSLNGIGVINNISGSGTLTLTPETKSDKKEENKITIKGNIGNKIVVSGAVGGATDPVNVYNEGTILNDLTIKSGSLYNKNIIQGKVDIKANAYLVVNGNSKIYGDILGEDDSTLAVLEKNNLFKNNQINVSNAIFDHAYAKIDTNDFFIKNSFVLDSELDFINKEITTSKFENIFFQNANFAIDVDLEELEMDQFSIGSLSSSSVSSRFIISNVNLMTDTKQESVTIPLFVDTDQAVLNALKNKVSTNIKKPIYSRIYKYDVSFVNNSTDLLFRRYKGNKPSDFNPYTYSNVVTAQSLMSLQTNIANTAMAALDTVTFSMSSSKISGLNGGDEEENEPLRLGNSWYKLIGFNEDLKFKDFENVKSKTGSIIAGINTEDIEIGDGDMLFGAYVGGVLGKQKYTNNENSQKGAYFGLNSSLFYDQFYIQSNFTYGFVKTDNKNMYGTDKIDSTWYNVTLKTGYNIPLDVFERWTLQPNLAFGLTRVKTKDYTSKSGIKFEPGKSKAYNIDPGVKLSREMSENWHFFATYKRSYIKNKSKETVVDKDVYLPKLALKSYKEIGAGIDVDLNEDWTMNLNVNHRSGDIEGWNGSLTFNYYFSL
ncbi:MAG: autotransporter outer membrane beta-barrel domain-containing protein [Alphaproteobacteria bacterium]|nr:autotransporter outer membrane beta-barrel domain-containing protein [Alphaproteobacteria bacterium]